MLVCTLLWLILRLMVILVISLVMLKITMLYACSNVNDVANAYDVIGGKALTVNIIRLLVPILFYLIMLFYVSLSIRMLLLFTSIMFGLLLLLYAL